MNDSKYDDYQRHLGKELIKKGFYLPYLGGIAASERSADYMRFLGIDRTKIQLFYNTVDNARLRRSVEGAASSPTFLERHFTVVARLVPKKNVSHVLKVYAAYAHSVSKPRLLHISGAGDLEGILKDESRLLGIDAT